MRTIYFLLLFDVAEVGQLTVHCLFSGFDVTNDYNLVYL